MFDWLFLGGYYPAAERQVPGKEGGVEVWRWRLQVKLSGVAVDTRMVFGRLHVWTTEITKSADI